MKKYAKSDLLNLLITELSIIVKKKTLKLELNPCFKK